jgi:L-iditol 2-dehydrogenase
MKVAIYYGLDDIRIEEIPTPKIGEDEVLVEMKACGVCGSDLMDWYLKNRAPLVLGHEPTGIIVEKGRSVKGFDVDDRVFVHHHVACLKCRYCTRGNYTLCKQFHETNIEPGGFSEYFRVPRPNLQIDTLKIPDTLPFDEATLIEPIGCCLRALKKCEVNKGDSVAIIGAGTTGIIHTALSKFFGAEKTIVCDTIDFRLRMAKKFGADVTVNPNRENVIDVVMAETGREGVDIAVVTAPSLNAYEMGLKACRKGGKLCMFAPTKPGDRMQISPKELFFSEVRLIPSYSTSHIETREALELLKFGELKLKEIITHRFSLLDAAKAFKTAREGKESLKVVIFSEGGK